ncbi:ATPase of the AAA class, partial [Coemansia sp. RSA 455]
MAFAHMNVEAPKGVLLYGPPGVGKTHLVRAISTHCNAKLTVIQGPEILGPYLGDSERRLREKFASAQSEEGASILFIDEIDSLAPSRTGTG